MDHVFEDIEVKRNAPEILEDQLRRRRKKCMISTGSMCDPYIPIEKDLKLTRQCLEIIEKNGFGLAILTKSAMIMRDMDILKAINKRSKCVVEITLTTYDEELCRKLEPDVSTTKERVEVLTAMKEAGIPTVVWLGPILPFINDTEENLEGLLDYCIKAGVHGILCFGFGLTLREGNREYFYSGLDGLFPGLKQKYIDTFGNSYVCNSPHNTQLMKLFRNTCRVNGIMHASKEIFNYLGEFDEKEKQISLFD